MSTGSCAGSPATYLSSETPSHTLQPTALIKETFLRTAQSAHIDYKSLTHFVAVARPLRATLIREQMAESVLICAAGSVGGILLSLGATEWLVKTWKDLPTAQSLHIDGAVIAFASALMFAAALIAGLLPALSSTGKSMLRALHTSVRTGSSSVSRTALRKSLLTAEIGINVVLLVAAGLLLKSFMQLRAANVGCTVDNTLTLQYNLPGKSYNTPEKQNAFNEALLARVRAMPGVRGAALGTTVPGTGYWRIDEFTVKEHPPLNTGEHLPDALTRWVDPGYFSALGIPLGRGRFFSRHERVARSYKVIVSRQLVQQYFAGEDTIGKHLHIPGRAHDGAPNLMDWEIVGVVGDILYQVGKEPKATIYFPLLELRGDTHLTVDAFRNEASRSCGSLRRDCNAAGGCDFGLLDSRMARFPVRSNECASNRVEQGIRRLEVRRQRRALRLKFLFGNYPEST